MKSFIVATLLSIVSLQCLASGSNTQGIEILPGISTPMRAGIIHYSFQLVDRSANRTLSDQDLQEDNTKKLHFIVYDASKVVFNHVHPDFDGKQWSVDLNLPVNGMYFLWAQGKLLSGAEFSTFVKSEIQGGLAEYPVVPLGDHRSDSDVGTRISLDGSVLKAGKMAMLNFTISRDDGQIPDITPYLGAFAHVIAVSPDGTELTHVHPMEGGELNTGMLHATFLTPGDYRIWVQLIDRGELKTIPLSVTVKN